ncbi:MAG: formylglycine-generating enzyme family protein [Oceanipulchritudo sp.]
MESLVATDALSLRKALILAPEESSAWPEWRRKLQTWAAGERARLGGVRYDAPAQAWASWAYAMGFIMLWDNELIDHTSGEWRVESLLDRAERDFGGYDVVCLWSNYPLSGVDPRHQLAYYDELPGGLAGLKDAVGRFHARGVRVLLDHKPWVPGVPAGHASVEDAFVERVRECDLDGLFLDCSSGPEEAFRAAMAERAGPGRIFVSEAPSHLEPFGHEIGCWQQMSDDSAAPGVYRNRWLDRNQIIYESRRYFHDPVRELQRGWMNGGGQVIWENIFGYWADYSARCKSWMHLLFPAQRRFADWFIRGEWQPHVGGGCVQGIYVSRWDLDGRTLWTAVNRRGHTVEKKLFTLPAQPGCRYVDVISGQEYAAEVTDGTATLCGWFERDGLAGILAVPEMDDGLADFLAAQRARFAAADWTAEPWSGEHRKTTLPHLLLQVEATPRAAAVPDGMVRVPDFDGWMVTRYRMRECGYIAGAAGEKHVYDAFEQECEYPRRARVSGVAIDAFPVTNAQYAAFLEATGYRPADPRNFLKHWTAGRPPAGKENHPVVNVSLQDARAYARWAGKRLPTEEEWQRAAQDAVGNTWPWGDEAPEGRCNSGPSGTTPVDAFPGGRTPSGVWDMSGNVWEMTESERSDGHTRYQILKGGSWYAVKSSHWLFDTGARPADWGAKHILLCEAWDRCETIGFRSVVDLDIGEIEGIEGIE